MKTLDSLVEKALSRRSFLVSAGLAGAGVTVAAAAVVGCGNNGPALAPAPIATPPPTPAAPTDADYLNFALNLEYLEAQFYLYAATGSGLASSDLAGGSASGFTTVGSVTTDTTVTQVAGLTSAQQEIINEIAYEEQAHVKFLRSALGSAAVAMPNIDLTFFGPLAMAAGATTVATGTGSFSPFASFDAFLIGSFIFEDVGVTAYAGAAGLISAAGVAAGFLTAAAGILAVEAYHAGYVRTSLTGRAIMAAGATPPTPYPYLDIANKVEALRDALTVGESSSVETKLVLPTSLTTPSSIVAASASDAVAFSRTVNQVHHIVYGDPKVGVAKGGFFPSGTNSIFATTTA